MLEPGVEEFQSPQFGTSRLSKLRMITHLRIMTQMTVKQMILMMMTRMRSMTKMTRKMQMNMEI